METYTQSELDEVLRLHALWLNGDSSGVIANLSDADLSDANLSDADLRYANLSDADLSDANLSGADLRYANLSDADLRGANLRGVDLRGANLRGVDLSEPVARLDFGGWSICVRVDKTSIGCQTHPNADWLKWSPSDVSHMAEGASEYWENYGDAIKAVILAVQKKAASGEAK